MNRLYIGLIFLFMIFYSCGGAAKTSSSTKTITKTTQKVVEINLDPEIIEECDLYLNFAFSNRQTEDHQGAVDNFNYVISQGCGSLKAESIYEWMGRSYIELAKYDSASWAFKEGISYMSDNEQLLEVAAWNAGKAGNFDDQIYYYDKILGINDKNLSALEKLSDLYGENEMLKEQLEILNLWLKVDPGNSKAISNKKSVYGFLGKDELDVDRERWENEPDNLDYGLDYLKSLSAAGLDEELIKFGDRMLVYDRKNRLILEILAETHLNLFNLIEAKEKYLYLYNNVNPDYKYSIEISKILMDETLFEDAYKWANDAIIKSNHLGESYYQRAEVLFQTAENCTGDMLLFDDKVVYELSVQDYYTSIQKGYYKGESRKEFLEENNITNQGDWFMRGEDQLEAKPSGNCYSWIDRGISRK